MKFYASVPYKIEAPRLTLTRSVSPAGRLVIACRAELKGEAAKEKHVIQFTLFKPGGDEWKELAMTVVSRSGEAFTTFELPLNLPAGNWKVVAREAISGLNDSAEISLTATRAANR